MFRELIKRVVGVFSGLTGSGRRMMNQVYASRVGDPPVRGTQEFLAVYETSPWVRAVAGRVGSSIGSTEWTLEARGREVPSDHIMLRTLRTPNGLMSGHDLMKITQVYLDLVGDAFWYKGRNGVGRPSELWPVPPHWIAELPTPDQPTFRLSYYSLQERVPDTEILWMHDAAPKDPYRRGSGLVRAQADELETFEYASKHAKQLFWNRATPEFVVMDDNAGPDEVALHERAWLQRLGGFWRSNKPYFTNRKLEFWQPQQMNLENLTMVPLLKHERDTILQAWGFSPEQLGITETSNRATADVSDYVFENRVVRPRRVFMRDQLQMKLAPEYDERLVVGFVDTVPEDKEHRLSVAKAAPHALTTDEWRAMMGQKPLGGELGASHLVPLNSYLAVDPLDPESRPHAAPAPAAAGGDPGDGGEANPEDPEDLPAPAAPPKPKTCLVPDIAAGVAARRLALARK